ncbi:ABC transporter substrate-binding protein [Avibacterium paragallinarum]|uniref:Putative ABC-type nitrate/sulfonate/bicarbonate transport system, periplasmic component n=1 Tax=Avibacterium paragallinarum TaxID=728 RepID=A0A377I9W3_AVIPA|nr:ABC transporter substrate-binding protein [Avibacterium paragallinarum]POY46328.1 thiamine biosynthesis protein [Avibacterium paragallinarum]RZN75465.1 thiamine biosynthesis protein [Avibacterium paragallinarum]CDF99647.1 Putative ABC superfamily ATP binding cassette transporter, binding protein [Avibacterium paragallinarum JF4211]STO71961.1 putative ABC-type nitrate/sulfonate/bicarbonate transport system, periplasmic component [Avibacterium paragallinarum]
MKKLCHLLNFILAFTLSATAQSKEKLTLLLDWFVNPDHAAIIVAQQKGFFAANDLEVEIVEPADPSMPPKLIAAGQADLAVDYQPQLQVQVAEGLPLVRVGTLISTPLNSLVVLESSNIQQLSDLKGKKIGYSVSGFEDALLKAMLNSVQLSLSDVELVNVNWSLSPALFSGQVDAVIGAFRNFELNQMDMEKKPGRAFYPEEHSVPLYDELILIANKNRLSPQKLRAFLTALEQATVYVLNHPEQSWQAFISYKPKDLDNELNRLAWRDTLPRLVLRPSALDNVRYEKMATFMQQQGLIKQVPKLADYAIQVE